MILESERLLFRPHQPSDLDPYCAIEADPQVRRYVGGAPRTREAAEQKFRDGLPAASNPLSVRATIFKPEGCYIGRCGLHPNFGASGPLAHEAALAFYLDPQYWGRGLATEASRVFIDYGFRELSLHRIVALVQVGNAASIRVLEKLGFVWTARDEGVRCFDHYSLSP